MKRVLLVLGMQLVAAALENLFSEADKFRLMSIPFTDGKAALECIDHFHPDVLIFDEILLQGERFQPMGLLEMHPKLTIMIIYADRNQVRVYEQRVINISRSSDLLGLIQPG